MTQSKIELALQRNQIHLWICNTLDICDSARLSQYRQLLNDEECSRVDRFYFDKDKHDYLVSHAMVRLVLSEYAAVAPQHWQFEHNAYGKPTVSSVHPLNFDLRFNLSHTHGKAVLAVTSTSAIGVDIESKERNSHCLNLANHFFSQSEAQSLNKLDKQTQQERFFDYWTLKEAFIKAVGKGLSIPLDSFSFEILPSGNIQLFMADTTESKPENWYFCSLDYQEEYTIALCHQVSSQAEPPTLCVRELTPGVSSSIIKPKLRYRSF